MLASSVNLLMSNAGLAGAELLRTVVIRLSKLRRAQHPGEEPSKPLLTSFLHEHRDKAQGWVGARLSESHAISSSELDELIKPMKISSLAQQIGRNPDDVVKLLNNALFQAVQLAAPDGERVSERAIKRLDEDLASSVCADVE